MTQEQADNIVSMLSKLATDGEDATIKGVQSILAVKVRSDGALTYWIDDVEYTFEQFRKLLTLMKYEVRY